MARKKRKGFMTAFSIIFILIFILGLLTHVLPQAEFVDGTIVNGSGVVGAKLSDILLSPILGFENAVDVCIFILILGGFLAIVARSEALETGIQVLVKKLKGNELALIPILMFIFSIAGTTYGMLEETVGFSDAELYEHMTFKKSDENFAKGVRENLKKQFQEDEAFEFLKEDVRWEKMF